MELEFIYSAKYIFVTKRQMLNVKDAKKKRSF